MSCRAHACADDDILFRAGTIRHDNSCVDDFANAHSRLLLRLQNVRDYGACDGAYQLYRLVHDKSRFPRCARFSKSARLYFAPFFDCGYDLPHKNRS